MDTEDVTYSPHSFRSFAENFMATCGLPEKFSDLIIGHKTLKTTHYRGNWDDTAKAWLEKCEPAYNFLTPPTANPEQLEKLEKEVRGLKKAVEGQPPGTLLGPIIRDKTTGEIVAAITLPPSPSVKEWENHTHYYREVEAGTDSYGQSLGEGFELVDSYIKDGKNLRMLRKPKTQTDMDEGRPAKVGSQ